jgi:hypothetical protein
MAESKREDDRSIELEAVQDLGLLRVPPATYYTVFVQNPEGRAVLEDLVGRFHDCELSPDAERTHDVAQALGARKAIGFILRRIAQIRDADTKKT